MDAREAIRQTGPGVVQVVGWSGSGKTTLLEQVIRRLRQRGLRVAVIKHSGGFDELDRPGKDSHRLRRAGAETSILASHRRTVVFIDHPGDPPEFDTLVEIARARRPDLILVESFGEALLEKIEVYRAAVGEGRLRAGGDPTLRAVVSDDPVPDYTGRVFPSGEIEGITDFLLDISRGGAGPRSTIPRS